MEQFVAGMILMWLVYWSWFMFLTYTTEEPGLVELMLLTSPGFVEFSVTMVVFITIALGSGWYGVSAGLFLVVMLGILNHFLIKRLPTRSI